MQALLNKREANPPSRRVPLVRAFNRREPQTPADAYRALIVESRTRQLKATAENVKRMERVFDAAVQSLARRVREAGSGTLQQAFVYDLLRDMDAHLKALRSDFAALLDVGMAEAAQIACDREAQAAEIVGAAADAGLMPGMRVSQLLSDGAQISVSFGQVALQAVERTANRVYSDGWKLSDRLYNLDAETRRVSRDTLVQGVAEQIGARKMAKRLEGNLADAGANNPRYQAMRIARTEINTSHREAHIQSTLDPQTGRLKDFILGIGWRLSMSHPRRDICDIWADDDGDGLGPGNYLPENVPADHPHGLCYTISVLKEFPEVSAPSKQADAGEAPESQARYYAEKLDDAAARRWLNQRGK